MISLYSCEGGICVVNDLLDGLERTSDKLPAIGTGREIFNAVNVKADWHRGCKAETLGNANLPEYSSLLLT